MVQKTNTAFPILHSLFKAWKLQRSLSQDNLLLYLLSEHLLSQPRTFSPT